METTEDIYIGSEVPFNIYIEPIDGVSAKDYDFNVSVYTSPKRAIEVQKSDLIKVDDDNYIVLVNTALIGTGKIVFRIEALVPDMRFPDGDRREIQLVRSKYNVVKDN